MSGDDSLSIRNLKAKYGREIIRNLEMNAVIPPYYLSLWWKDNCRVGVGTYNSLNRFSDGVVRKVGNGESTHFWQDTWVGETPLVIAFRWLYAISNQKDSCI